MEDVSSTFSAHRNKYNLLANGTFNSKKKSSFTKNINEGSSFSMTESDEECAEIFKQTHIKPPKVVSLKRKASKKLKKDQSKKENSDVMGSLAPDGNSIGEDIFQIDLNDKRTSGTDEVAAPSAVNADVVNHPCGPLTQCQITNKSSSPLAGHFLDSGYNSFSDEKSILSSSFLSFEEELVIARADDQFYNCYTPTKEVLVKVEEFLSHSPPSLSALSNLEHEITKGSAFENLLYLPHTEYLQKNNSTCLMSHSTISSRQNSELNSLKFSNHPSEKGCIYSTTNDKIFDVPSFCDYDVKVHKDAKNENLVASNHTQINIGPPQYFAEENNHGVDSNELPILVTDQNESLQLFEDTEFNDVSLSPSNNECKFSCVTDKTCMNKMAPVSQFLISDELLLDNDSEPQDQIISDSKSWKSHEDLTGVHEEKLKSDEYVYDCSKDLFSITFDLGFCIPDSDDEILEHVSHTNKNKILDALSGKCLDIKEISDVNYVSNQAIIPRDHIDSSKSRSVAISPSEDKQSPASVHFPLSTAKNEEFMSPGYSQFSLPVGEKVMSTPLFELNTLNSKKRKEMPRLPDSNKGKENLQSFKETLNSTFDDSGLSTEKAKDEEQIILRQTCNSAGGKSSSL